MILSRRDFLNLCTSSAAALGLTAADVLKLQEALANQSAPTVLWLQGSGCTGCSVSFLNYIYAGSSPILTASAPKTVADVLISTVNVAYHPTVMAAAGQTAVDAANAAYSKGGYVLVVEGGVPTAFGGKACFAYNSQGAEVTFQDAVKGLAAKAAMVVSVGSCACYGGVSGAAPNLSGVASVQTVVGKPTLNIPGCPPHPDWIVWAIAQILAGTSPQLDSYGRPVTLFARTVHDQCPRREREEAHTYGQDGYCLEEIGCMGPRTRANCPVVKWNNGVNWCVDANSQCIGCTEPTFPAPALRHAAGTGGDD